MSSAVERLGKLGVGLSDPVDTLLNFSEFEPGIRTELINTNGTRGTFDEDGNRLRTGRTTIAPRIKCEPTHLELKTLIPVIMGAAGSGSPTITYDYSNTALPLVLYYLPVAGDQLFYTSNAVDTATFSAASGEALSVDLSLVGTTYDAGRSDFPSLTPDQSTQPFIMSDLGLTGLSLGGSGVACRSFSLTVNNNIDKGRFLGSNTLTRLQKLSRVASLSVDVPAGDNAGLWDDGLAGITFTATFANSSNSKSLVLTCPDLRFDANTATYAPGQEGFLRIEAKLYRTAATPRPLRITMTS